MRKPRIRPGGVRAVPIALAAAVLALPGTTRAQTASYLDFDALSEELRSLADGSDAVQLRSLAQTAEGREVWVVEIGAPGGVPLDERPAVLVVGNLEGDHLVGSALSLEIVRNLAEGAGDPEIDRVLREHTVYVFPRLNPDGAEVAFGEVEGHRRTNARPYDDDNDGRTDEDGPEDLNGDGVITVMRVREAGAPYMLDPDDPRLLREADPAAGEEGGYGVYPEGVDSDGDGYINEDGAGGVDLNRNFQHEYPYWEADAGPHMVSEPESRALMDFVVAHRNVATILTFGLTDNLVTPPDQRGQLASETVLDLAAFADAADDDVFQVGLAPSVGGGFGFFGSPFRGAQPGRDNDPGSGRRPATTVDGDDLDYFERASELYREATGIEEVGLHRTPEGAFFQYGYFQFGVPSFSTPGWGLPEAEGGGEGTDGRILTALEEAGIDAFVDWSEYEHPDLGTVEIGGFRPSAVTNPPAGQIPELGKAHADFVVRLAGMLPRLGLADAEVQRLGGDLFKVSVAVENTGYFPTSTEHGLTCRCVEPVTVQIQVPPDDVVTGDPKTVTVRKLDGAGNRESFSWVIRASLGAQIEIRAFSPKAGRDATTVTLR